MSRYTSQRDVVTVADRALFDGVLRPGGRPGRTDAYLAVPTPQAHAAMLARLPDESLGLVWFGGTQEGVGDISVWFARLPRGAATWSTPQRLTDDETRSEQNPVLFTTPEGELWLLYTAQSGGDQDTAEVRRRVSADGGSTWAPPTVLFPAAGGAGVFIRHPLVVTRTGRWLLPIFRCPTTPGRRWTGDRDTSAVMISDDAGRTWRAVEVPDSLGAVHMSVVQLPDGRLHAVFRSRWADRVRRSVSTDDGETWTAPTSTELPNNNSSLQHAVTAAGDLVLIYNHSSREDADGRRASLYDEIDTDGALSDAAGTGAGASDAETTDAFWGAPRAPLTLATSVDGEMWTVVADLEQGDGYCMTNNSIERRNREFSYPVVLPGADGSLDLAFTFFRQTIKHVHLEPGWRDDRG